jgi:hypothetical protein
VGYDISPLKRVKLKIFNLIFESGEISELTWTTEGEFVSPII